MAIRMVVAYDIGNDSNRARVAALLASYGTRIQRSVFVCQIGQDALPELTEQISDIINLKEDVVHFIPTCAQCQEGQRSFGQVVTEGDTPFWLAF